MRPSWVEVDLDAIRSNVAAIRDRVAPARLCAVVKADAYGHGDVPCAEAALAGGAEWLAVALVEEGVRLREAGITAPVFLLSEPPLNDVAGIIEWDLVPTGYRSAFCEALAEEAARRGADPYPIHLKVDTGMHRVGADPAEAPGLVRAVANDPRLRLDGLWTHFPVSESDPDFTRHQVAELLDLRDALAAAGIEIPMVHAANSAGALDLAEVRLDMVRVGLGIYGLRPDRSTAPDLPLRPAMRVVSEVAFVRRLPAGARPSYGRRRPLPADATVATVPIGYADGVCRRLSEVGGVVLIRGRRYPFAGTVTMDQIVVDMGDDPVTVGDEVVVLGSQGRDAVTAEEWAERLGTINYEIVCQFGPRLPRRYAGSPDA